MPLTPALSPSAGAMEKARVTPGLTALEREELSRTLHSLRKSSEQVLLRWSNTLPKPPVERSADPTADPASCLPSVSPMAPFPWRTWATAPVQHLWRMARPHLWRWSGKRLLRPLTRRLLARWLTSPSAS